MVDLATGATIDGTGERVMPNHVRVGIAQVERVSQESERFENEESSESALVEAEPAAVALPDPLGRFGLSVSLDAPVLPAPRTLEIGGEVSFVLDVSYPNRAEAFYHRFFEMGVVCRAWRRDRHWEATTEEIDWTQLMLWGEYPELVYLHRPGWSIVLHAIGRGQVLTSPKLGDAEVPVSRSALRKLRARALMKSYTILEDSPDAITFRDPFAVVWRLVADDAQAG